ncbi:protein-tyrosine phosphatase-like protein [Lentinula aff. lateritia]|uniref:Protein-tyrosine phosphatase-like protein n=1 Tax=Lentinula aff. lateritia TaxID=2804960 RepID=A0ACC1TKI0_9AGAR|nr:protein-tyrosine phosphatase-like protein [Lentinula aff. lateritia]
MSFTVSTILPGFLFLGPEPTNWDHVKQLKELGVRRIVNLAAECGPDDWGLGLDKPGNKEKAGSPLTDESSKESGFEKYYKIAMRDTVEEDGIGRGVRVACEMLDHARLLSAPVYVHCKAGKSRSVTAVIAYLIHANHWPLSKAYSFVLERRKGISPNIGFVSELMGFEEEELGGKSGGVTGALPQPSAPAATREDHGGNAAGGSSSNNQHGYGVVASMRKSANARESMPPSATHIHHGYSYSVNEPSITSRLLSDDHESGSGSGGSGVSQGPSFPPLSAGGILALGDAAQELEVRDASGRYRHARRAPVNEMTLQPMRRVSKAGLESGEFYRSDGRTTWGEEEEEAVVIQGD